MKLSDTGWYYHDNCESDIVCGKYDENLAICIVMSAQATISKAMILFRYGRLITI